MDEAFWHSPLIFLNKYSSVPNYKFTTTNTSTKVNLRQLVLQKEKTNTIEEFNIAFLKAGVYILVTNDGERRMQQQFVKL